MRVTYGKSVHDKREVKAVLKVLNSSTQMGINVKKLENSVAKIFNKKFGVMFNSASSALLVAFEIINLKKNSEIITPCLNFGTAVSSIIKAGLIPKFVDVEVDTFCIDYKKIVKNITNKTKAVCIPNLIGNLPDWEKIRKIAKKKKLIIIEDSADTLGSKINTSYSGKFTDLSVTSFYGSHIINGAGNGGMLLLNNKNQYNKALMLRSWGRSSSVFQEDSEKIENRFNIKLDGIDYDRKFIFQELGYNLEPSEISAAFALEQLKKLKKNIKIRERNFNLHFKFFQKFNDYFILPKSIKNVKTAWLAFPLIIKKNKKFSRKKLQIFLEKNNIQTRVIFTGNILRQPAFKYLNKNYKKNSFPNSDIVMQGGMLIGLHQGLSIKQIKYVHHKFKIFFRKVNILNN